MIKDELICRTRKPDQEYASQQNQIQNMNKTKTETRSNKN